MFKYNFLIYIVNLQCDIARRMQIQCNNIPIVHTSMAAISTGVHGMSVTLFPSIRIFKGILKL